jgi:hypothetical protein
MAAPASASAPGWATLASASSAGDPNGVGASGADVEEAPKVKSALVVAAERLDRQSAVCSGYLRKQNSEGKWQRRYFEILVGSNGAFFVYYKRHDSPVMLCSMDLWRATVPELAPATEGDPAPDTFGITWDRFRLFRATSHADAVRWVTAMLQVQARRPAELSGGLCSGGCVIV